MERVQQISRKLAETTQERLLSLWALHQAGTLPLDEFRTLGAALVAQANTAGVQLADMAVTAEMARQLRSPVAPLGLTPNPVQVDQSRIARDIDRILAATPNVEDLPESQKARLGAWARSEPLLTVATATQVAMKERGATGWVRQTAGKSCPLCASWDDGVVRSPSVQMARHPGCDCIQSPQF